MALNLYHYTAVRHRTDHSYSIKVLEEMGLPQSHLERWKTFISVNEVAFVLVAVPDRAARTSLENLKIISLPHEILVGQPENLRYEQEMIQQKYADLTPGDWVQVQLPAGQSAQKLRYFSRYFYRKYEVSGVYLKELAHQVAGVAPSFFEVFKAQNGRLLHEKSWAERALNHTEASQREAFKRQFVDDFVPGRSVFCASW